MIIEKTFPIIDVEIMMITVKARKEDIKEMIDKMLIRYQILLKKRMREIVVL